MSKKTYGEQPVTIHIKNLHIHMDEHMDSTNFYNPLLDKEYEGDCDGGDTDCYDCVCRDCPGCTCDSHTCGTGPIGNDCTCDEVEVDLDELVQQIRKDTSLPVVIIERVLAAESKYLAKMGIGTEVKVVEDDNHTEENEPSEDAKKSDTSHTATIPDELKEKLAPLMAGIALIGFLKEVCGSGAAEADETTED